MIAILDPEHISIYCEHFVDAVAVILVFHVFQKEISLARVPALELILEAGVSVSDFELYSRTSMAGTHLEPQIYVRDRDSST